MLPETQVRCYKPALALKGQEAINIKNKRRKRS
jgi:hypothetical protein